MATQELVRQPVKEDFSRTNGITLFQLDLSSELTLRAEAVYVKIVFEGSTNFPINVTDPFTQISERTFSVPPAEALSDDHGIRLLAGVYLVNADRERIIDQEGHYAYYDEVKEVDLIRLYRMFRLVGYLANQPGFKLADIDKAKKAINPYTLSRRLEGIFLHRRETSFKPSVVSNGQNGSHLHVARTLTEYKEYLGLPAPLELDNVTKRLEAAGMPFYVAK